MRIIIIIVEIVMIMIKNNNNNIYIYMCDMEFGVIQQKNMQGNSATLAMGLNQLYEMMG